MSHPVSIYMVLALLSSGVGCGSTTVRYAEPRVEGEQHNQLKEKENTAQVQADVRRRAVEQQAEELRVAAEKEAEAAEKERLKLEEEREKREKDKPIQFFVTLSYGVETLKLPIYELDEMRPFHGVRCFQNSGRSKGSSVGYHESTSTISCGDIALTTTCQLGGDVERLTNHSTQFVNHNPSPIKVKLSCQVKNR